MSTMKKGDKAVKVIDIMGSRTATVVTLKAVKESGISIVESNLRYDWETLGELDAVIPGCTSYLVPFDDGEAKRLDL